VDEREFSAWCKKWRDFSRFMGERSEALKLFRRLGEKKFGPPDRDAELAITGMLDLEEIEDRLTDILDAGSWRDLFAAR
jgi:hypothetical protein